MIDLSHLTEEEQGVIMTVLKRDAELKKAEEERIKQLQSLLIEENQLKYMTGEWFYEVKSQRHQDRIHGSEIILASMRQKKPDFTRSLERPRRGSGYDDVVMSTAKPLSQQTKEEAQQQRDRKSESLPSEARQEVLRQAMRSPKLRHNPFNNVQVEFDTDRPCPQLTNGTQRPLRTLECEVPSAQRELVSDPKAEEPEVPAKRPAPVPRKRTKPPRTQSSRTDSSGSGLTSPTTSTTSTTRGILKPASSCSSVDSHQREPARVEVVQERESGGAIIPVVDRREERDREEEVTYVGRREEEKQGREEERREEGARHFVPVSLANSREEWQTAEMPQQYITTSMVETVQQSQIERSSRLPVGQQRETTPRSDEGQWRETPPQMSRPKHDVPRGLGLSVFTSPEEWKPSGGRAQPLTSPYSSSAAGLAWPPNSDQPPREKADPQSMQRRWRESSAEKTQQIIKHDPDSRAKNSPTDTTETAEGALYESKRTGLPSAPGAVETSTGAERTKSPTGPVTLGAPVTPGAPASQTSKLTEEEGASIAKVLEWFNRSTDSSNRPDTDSAQDLEETKDDITDSEEEAKVVVSKPAANVYTIIPRQEKPKEKTKLIPDDTCWADEQSVDLSDEVPEQSDPLKESPTITVRPFQPALSRDATYQLRHPAAAKPETSSQPQQPTQSPLQTETTYQSQQPTQSPLQTETSYHSKRSIPSSLQTETNYQSKRSVSSALQKEGTYQSKQSVQSPLQTENTYQQPIQPLLQTAASYHSKRSIQSPLQTENNYQSKRSIQSPPQEEITYKSQHSIQSPPHTETTMETNRTACQSKHSMQSVAKTETSFQAQVPLLSTSSTNNKEVLVQAHPPVHSMLKTETAFKAQQHRPETQRQGDDRQEEGRARMGAGPAAGGDAHLDSRVSQQQDNQDGRPKIANLKSFWERGSSGPKILISRTNLKMDKKMVSGQQVDREQTGRQQEEQPQRIFEVRSMSSSLNPSNEGKPQRKQIIEVKAPKEREEDVSAGQQRYISAGFGDENVPEIAYSTQRSDTFEVNNLIEQDIISTEVKSPSVSVNTSRFAKKVSEEAMKYPRTPASEDILKHPREEALKYPRTANESSVPPTRPEHAPRAEEREEEPLPESRSLSRTSTPVLSSSPVLQTKQNQNAQHPENRRERLRQLKSFWESEISASKIASGRSRDAESKSSGSSSSTLNKRFTKSAFDLRSMGLSSTDDFDDVSGDQSFSGFTTKDKTEKPPLGDANFKSLRNFWSGSPSVQARPKSPTSKDRLPGLTGAPRPASPQTYGRPREDPSSPSLKSRHKGRDEGSTGSGCKRTSVDSRSGKSSHRTTSMEPEQNRKGVSHHQSRRNSEQVSLSSSLALKNRAGQPPRRTSTGNLNERAGAMRRATSMYSLAFSEDQEQTSPKPSKRSQELGTAKPKKTPEFGLSFSKKSTETGKSRERLNERRPSTERRPSRTSDDPDWQPLARSFIPRDYQHYLGIPEKTGTCPTAPPPEQREELCTSFSSQPDCEWSRPSGPARSSTPVGTEEGGGGRGSLGPRSAFAVQAKEDFSQESPRSSASESWTSSRKNSKCEEEEEDEGPVQKALRRAAARPAFTKSLEDITIATGPERESEKTGVFMHSSGDASPDASTLASSFSEPEHVRKMSKSVPSFLQEDASDDSDSEESSQSSRGRRPNRMGVSLSNLSGSSVMASVSSVSGSVMSVCSGDFGGVEVQGTIQFTLNYVQKLKEFHIFVVQCKNLAAVDAKRSRSDPYVKSYLIPDKAGLGKRKTSVKKKTMNPLFNEILRYRVRMDYLKNQVLNLSVWHHDTFGKNSFLGEVEVDLSVWDFNNTQMNYMSLKARTTCSTQPTEYRGEMRLSIRYLPQMSYSKMAANSGEVHIWVKECKNLPLVRGATIDPYVKCFVLPDTSRKSRQKTRVLKRTDCPVFNHTMVYDGFQPEDLREACVELTVWDRDRLANHLLGGLRLGMGTGKSYGALVDWMDSTGQEVALWERMMENPTEWVEDVLPLRVLMTHANK